MIKPIITDPKVVINTDPATISFTFPIVECFSGFKKSISCSKAVFTSSRLITAIMLSIRTIHSNELMLNTIPKITTVTVAIT